MVTIILSDEKRSVFFFRQQDQLHCLVQAHGEWLFHHHPQPDVAAQMSTAPHDRPRVWPQSPLGIWFLQWLFPKSNEALLMRNSELK
jgi:hypothetical protein